MSQRIKIKLSISGYLPSVFQGAFNYVRKYSKKGSQASNTESIINKRPSWGTPSMERNLILTFPNDVDRIILPDAPTRSQCPHLSVPDHFYECGFFRFGG